MKKTVILLFSAAMILGTTAGTALAKPGNTPPGHSSHDVKANESKETKESKDKNKDKDKQIEANQDEVSSLLIRLSKRKSLIRSRHPRKRKMGTAVQPISRSPRRRAIKDTKVCSMLFKT